MIVGLDISSFKLALAVIDREGYSVLELNSSSKKSWVERFYFLYDKFQSYVQENLSSDDVVYIEDMPYVRNKKSYATLTHFLAMCRLVLYANGIHYYVVHHSTWKKAAEVKTYRLKSDQVKVEVAKRCKELFDVEDSMSQDCMDALLIAYYGYMRENNNG